MQIHHQYQQQQQQQHALAMAMADTSCLLRCAATHDWDTLIHYGDCLSNNNNNLSLLLLRSENDGSSNNNNNEHVTLFPQNHCCYYHHHHSAKILHACDQYGNSVIQLACYHRPPVSVIRSLLFHAVATPHERQVLVRHRALDGSTALQIACATGASIDVIRILVSLANDLVGEYDLQGASPISELMVQYSLERMTPAHRHYSRPLDQITTVQEELGYQKKKPASVLFRTFWTKLCLLLGLVVVDDEVGGDPSPTTSAATAASVLCRAASIAHTISDPLTDLLLRSSTGDDDDDVSVAAVAQQALSTALRHCPCPNTLETEARIRQEYFISKLLDRCPQAASMTVVATAMNDDGGSQLLPSVFPLALAAQQGYSFEPILHSMAHIAPHTIGRCLPWIAQHCNLQDVFCILQLHPQALHECRRSK
jgi:hypothetical protein